MSLLITYSIHFSFDYQINGILTLIINQSSTATTNKRPAEEQLTNSSNAKKSDNNKEIEIDAQLLEKQRSSNAIDTASAAVAAAATKDTSSKSVKAKDNDDETEVKGTKSEAVESSEEPQDKEEKPVQQGAGKVEEEEEDNENKEETKGGEKQTPQEAVKTSNEHYQRYQQEVQNQAPPQPTRLPPSQSSDSSKPQHGTEEWHRQRRENHKEVERKRREAINVGIRELAQLIPTTDTNKAQILQRSVEYIKRLKENENNNIEKWTLEKLLTEQAVSELSASNEKLKHELELAYREIEQLKRSAKK